MFIQCSQCKQFYSYTAQCFHYFVHPLYITHSLKQDLHIHPIFQTSILSYLPTCIKIFASALSSTYFLVNSYEYQIFSMHAWMLNYPANLINIIMLRGCINDEAPKNYISSSLILHPSHIQTFLDAFLNTINVILWHKIFGLEAI